MVEKLNLIKLNKELSFRNSTMVKPRGKVVEVHLNPLTDKYTHFEVKEITQKPRLRPKKPLGNKDLNQYYMVGKCVSFRKRGINSSFIVRNVTNLVPYEMTYLFFSLSVENFTVRDYFHRSKRQIYQRAAHYQLRRIPPSKSQVSYEFNLSDENSQDITQNISQESYDFKLSQEYIEKNVRP